MRHSTLLMLILFAAFTAPVALSQCPEPSALDERPEAPPLLVERVPGHELRIRWEDVRVDGFRLHRGNLRELAWDGSFDHRVIVETAEPEVVIETRVARDRYFLVNSHCRAGESGVGRDSRPEARPWGGLGVVAVGLQGGMGVVASQFTLEYPGDDLFWGEGDLAFVGPYDPEIAVLAQTGSSAQHRISGAAVQSVDGPGFDPPADEPVHIFEMSFGYHGEPPPEEAFSVTECSSTSSTGESLPEVDCFLSRYEVLF